MKRRPSLPVTCAGTWQLASLQWKPGAVPVVYKAGQTNYMSQLGWLDGVTVCARSQGMTAQRTGVV